MKIIKISILILILCLLCALTPQETHLYGSRIITCEKDGIIKHWTSFQENEKETKSVKYKIIDLKTRKTYPIEDCTLYKCSPNPDRLKGCMMNK